MIIHWNKQNMFKFLFTSDRTLLKKSIIHALIWSQQHSKWVQSTIHEPSLQLLRPSFVWRQHYVDGIMMSSWHRCFTEAWNGRIDARKEGVSLMGLSLQKRQKWCELRFIYFIKKFMELWFLILFWGFFLIG